MSDTKKTESTENRREIKDLIARGKAFSFIGPAITKAYKDDEDGECYIESIASSDQQDLVGDIMAQKALDTMKTEFVGKTVFMNHRTNVPDDVFGSVVSCEFLKQNGMVLLKMVYNVEQENEAAMKTFRILQRGKTQLGSSVTVLVKNYSPNPKRKGGIVIEDVEPIEVSIVGVPCNKESKTMAASASKALGAALKSKEFEMEVEKTEAVETEATETDVAQPVAAETSAEEAVETPVAVESTEAEAGEVAAEGAEGDEPVQNKFYIRAAAARQKFLDLIAIVDKGGELPVVETVAVKGLFNEILEQEPTFWELVYILDEVRWMLSHQVYLIKAGGSDDVGGILGDWSEAIEEFKAAAMSSFKWWNDIERDDVSKFLSISEIEANSAAAVELEKGLNAIVPLYREAKSESMKKEFAEIGQRMIGQAKELGIAVDTSADPANPEANTDDVETLKKQLEEAEGKAADLQKQFDDTNQELDVARAGLEIAIEANKKLLGQPLNVGAGR